MPRTRIRSGIRAAQADASRRQPEWLSAEAVAERLDLKLGHLRALVARREIPVWRVGRLLRFHWPTVERWLLEGGDTALTNLCSPVRS
jgi:excisionase family DNA binding protein